MAGKAGSLAVVLGALLVVTCHEAPRDNPLDPELTPPVELAVALDEALGAVTLTWAQYEGRQPFAQYRVLRNVVSSAVVEPLDTLFEVTRTTYVDTTLAPNTAYVYRVTVVNTAGFEVASAEQRTAGFTVEPVVLLEVALDPRAGAVWLRWSRFTGARFQAYRVERRSAEAADFAVIGQTEAVGDTAYVDADLEPDLPYFYRVVVRAAGQAWPSNTGGQTRL
ncbi:MAG: hypothetical protein AB1505_02175, partial [Candidatus Latescibacterota bacterium]